MIEKIGILGLGKMGEAIAFGVSDQCAELTASTRTLESAETAQKALEAGGLRRVHVGLDNRRVARSARVLILSVKPHQAQAVLEEIRC